ncbi:zinc finger BED domain-containing protein RICESLEEPER 2-like [Spinacia oleracea]|uniref:Zinc finger BED domain-containing protein RICESLEEPER 2-like n=1 Tax=Spinacia oleracea TaxID=3562 RepID=A0A9R0KAK4_SPIOL|nr:zinc finger BED domain-containing protein RICESLEEPER 2-like [Spinacia oleracea]
MILQGDEFSEESVCQPTSEEKLQRHINKIFLCPGSCYESLSLHSSDYFDSSTIVSKCVERLVTVSKFTIDPIRLRRELAKMIVLHEYPLSVVNHIGFRDFLYKLNPSFRMVSQKTVENDIMKVFKFERCIAHGDCLNAPGRIAITKMWTSSDGNRRFLAITGHIIDEDWKRQSFIMRFANVPLFGTNQSICKVLLDCFSFFDMDKRLSTITVDSYTSNDELIDLLVDKLSENELPFRGKLFRLPCFAHTLSLMVQDAFDVVRHVIEKIRDSIMFWTSSPEREMTFEKAACELGLSTPAKLVLDYGLSWSSTYLMMQHSFLLKDVFSHLGHHESLPSKEEWDLVREVCDRLKFLFDKMKSLADCPVACLYLELICEIKVNFLKWLNCEVPWIKEMASKMLKKFDKYWLAARDILGVATIFHPQYRFCALEHYFKKIYGNDAEDEVDRIHQIFYDLFKEYKSSLMKDKKNDEDLSSGESDTDLFSRYKREMKKKQSELYEVEYYLKVSVVETEDSDILSWWEVNKQCYSVLHKMARDILAIPVFAVDVEDAFDVGDKILGSNRSRLHPTVVEALVCSQKLIRRREHSESKAPSSANNLHSLGTIYDDANFEDGIILKAKSAEIVDENGDEHFESAK